MATERQRSGAAAARSAGALLCAAALGAAMIGQVPASAAGGAKHACVRPRTAVRTTRARPAAKLLGSLAVLRRGGGRADALPPRVYLAFGDPVYVRYIRRARTVAGVRYYVIPTALARCGAKRPVQAVSFLASGGGVTAGTAGVSAATFARRGEFFATGSSGRQSTVQGLVPDGVRAVTLVYAARRHPQRGRVAITARTVANVVVFRSVPRGAGVAPVRTVWRGSGGRVLRTFAHRL